MKNIYKLLIITVIKIVLIDCYEQLDDVPCSFHNTINITDGVQIGDSILYNGVTYTPGFYGTYNYEYINVNTKYLVEPHLRGCICKLKSQPCIRFCCPTGFVYDADERKCTPDLTKMIDRQLYINVTNVHDDITAEENLYNVFSIIPGKPCSQMFFLEPEENGIDDEWILMSNGAIVLQDDMKTEYNKDHYCITPYLYNKSEPVGVRAMICFVEKTDYKYQLYPIGMLLSIPFLLITFLVYALIPELRNLHGRCLMCYVAGLTLGYSVLAFVQLNGDNQINPIICSVLGFTIYYAFMFSFFWLNVMCIDIWWTFKGVRGSKNVADRKKYILYSLYAWGSSLTMLSVAIFMQFSGLVEDVWSPGFGERSCWLKDSKRTEFIYLYLPIIILILINLTLFIITAYTIRKLQQETASIVKRGDSRKHSKFENDKDRFGLYLRLFIIMGVTWSMEAISWITDSSLDRENWFFVITDICNSLQGFLIFVFIVWKPKVKTLILKRHRKFRGKPAVRTGTTSGRTSTSHISMSTNNEKSLMTDIEE